MKQKKTEPVTIQYVGDWDYGSILKYYDALNNDTSHYESNDDICTPMECVTTMVNYIPEELWKRDNLKVIDVCCGNGNFGVGCLSKTALSNIWFNELSPVRYENCKKLLNPEHLTMGDALEIDSFGEWDLSIANPPYSGGGNKNQSLSNKFIEHSIKLLKNGGYLCFVAPNNWMTYNNNNTTLKKLLGEGSFLVIDNTAKKYFPGVGSSFTIFVWVKGVFGVETTVYNNYVVTDKQVVRIPENIPFIPLYLSQDTISIVSKCIDTIKENGRFFYRCDLHNFTQKDKLSDVQDEAFKYETIHTARKTRYAVMKQDIYDKWIDVIPLSTYYIPTTHHNVNVTQSVGYVAFDTEKEAVDYIGVLNKDLFKAVIHLTRYGNFNNIMVLKHIMFDSDIQLTDSEKETVSNIISKLKY